MVKCLEEEGIKTVFGYPGVAIAPFYDGLHDSEIEHVLVRGEQSAGHAASGMARISRRPAVCVTTSGPGATNLITALATAYADSIPIIAITGQVDSSLLGRDVFQEADITGATESFTKYRYLVNNVNDIPRIFKEAFYIANTGRKGPVLIDIPVDIQRAMMTKEFNYSDIEVRIRGYKPPSAGGNRQQMRKVVAAINKSKHPLICAGGGVILGNGEEQVTRFCEKNQIPLVHTMMGMGVMPKDHPLYFGMLGNNGKPYANKAVSKSDLLIIVGARVADRAVAKPKNLESKLKIIHIDIDTAEIGKNLGPTIPLVGDVRDIFSQLLKEDIHIDTTDWVKELEDIKHGTVDSRVFSSELVNPNLLVQTLSEKMDEDAIYVADVGQNQLWSADNYVMKKGRFLTTGGMGTMGYSIAAAIGAKMCAPDRQVVAVCGDGAFQMSMNELATARVNDVALKVVIVRNRVLGLVREYQMNTYKSRYEGISLYDLPRYDRIAEAYDMEYLHIENNSEVEPQVEKFLSMKEPCLMVAEVDDENNVK